MGKSVRNVKIHGRNRVLPAVDWFDPRECKEVPWLNVSGLWLAEAGFKVGDAIEIMVEQKKLTIKNNREDGNPRD